MHKQYGSLSRAKTWSNHAINTYGIFCFSIYKFFLISRWPIHMELRRRREMDCVWNYWSVKNETAAFVHVIDEHFLAILTTKYVNIYGTIKIKL